MFPVGGSSVTCATAPPPEGIIAARVSTTAQRRTGAPDLSLSAGRIWPRTRSTRGRRRCDIGAVGAFKQRRIQVIGIPDDGLSPWFAPIRKRSKERAPPRCRAPTGRGMPRGLDRVAPSGDTTSCATPSNALAAVDATQIRDAKARRKGATGEDLRPEPWRREHSRCVDGTRLHRRSHWTSTKRSTTTSRSVELTIRSTACPAAPPLAPAQVAPSAEGYPLSGEEKALQ